MSSKTSVYSGHVINPVDETNYVDIPSGAIAVDAAGKILAVGTREQVAKAHPDAQFFDFGTKLIMPGLVDLHIHLPQFTQIGKSGQTLISWLEKYIFPAETKFADADHATKIAKWFFQELARNGTTLAAVFTTIHWQSTDAAFQVAADQGARVIMGKVLMDRNAPPSLQEETAESLKRSAELCDKWHGYDDDRLLYSFIPRFAITCTPEQLLGVADLWRSKPGTYLHTHLAESQEEVEMVERLFGNCRSYTDVYAQHGLTGERSIFAHSIHLDDADISLLNESRSSIAHCPSSNFFLKSGRFKYDVVRDAGVRFGLGSDVAAGPYMSLFQVMRDANYMQPHLWIPAKELLYRATLGGAKAAHLDHKLGSLDIGKEGDFIVVDPTRKSGIAADILSQPTEEILSSLVFMGDDRLVEATFIRGRCVFELENGLVAKSAQALSGTHI